MGKQGSFRNWLTLFFGSAVAGIKSSRSNGTDGVDRLNHRYTVLLLVLFAVVVTMKQYAGDPIHCWCPAEFTDSHCNYTEAYCWISNTYFVPGDDPIPFNVADRYESRITYYQWVPLILLFLAFLVYVPHLLWQIMTHGSGLNLERLIDGLGNLTWVNEDGPKLDDYVTSFHRWLSISRRTRAGKLHACLEYLGAICFFWLGRRRGSYMTGLYLLTKFLYLALAIGVILLLNVFLAMDYNIYGIQVIRDLVEGRYDRESPLFPRITLCDFQIRQLQNIQTFTVQCVLSVNLFNEKIFIFLWFWFVLLAATNAVSYGRWMLALLLPVKRDEFVHKYLKDIDPAGYKKKGMNSKFTRTFLAPDGILVLHILKQNTNDLIVHDLVEGLWHRYKPHVED